MSKTNLTLISLLVLGLGLRLFLTPYLSYRQDIYTYIYWSESLLEKGPKAFFVDNWVDYLPGYPYILWLLAFVKSALHLTAEPELMFLYKLPAVLADIVTAFLIYKICKKTKWGLLATAVYLFNPAIFGNSSLWGQTDSFTALTALAAFYFASLGQPVFSGFFLGWGTLIKLNTILIAPIIGLIFLKKFSLRHAVVCSLIAAGIFFLGFLPFNNQPNFFQFVQDRISITTNQYPHTSLNAFNLWFLLDGSWKSDQDIFAFGLTKHTWGNLLFLCFYAFALFMLLRKKFPSLGDYAKTTAIGFAAAFLLLTRMHERHFFAALPFFLIAQNWSLYIWYSFSYTLNLIFGYQQVPGNPVLIPLSANITSVLSLGNLLTLLPIKKIRLPKLPHHQPTALLIILTFALFIRLFRLGTPPEYHFDEVYHAFTAREMLHGNVKAWEWWNQAPQGVAYEWTHPPLSKHFMVLGMQIFGDNAWGWRLPSVLFGLANIYLVYLLTKQLFPKSNIPLLAAGLYSVESLTFVQSRIGMNDTYMIFFMLFSLYALLRRKLPASMLGFGLALATKWSAVYIAPLLGLIIIVQNRRRLIRLPLLAIGYTLVAILVYLLSYVPFFASGHTWKQFIELQQQMFWYHTRLNATHTYSSPAWSWPILLRPVWYYVKYGDTKIANIYALGNPIIFWGGLLSVVTVVIILLRNLVKNSLSIIHNSLFIILLGYLLFWLPWLFSPRIMFLYHYLPSIPFMVILLAWILSHKQALSISFITLAIYVFLFFYPHLTALPVPINFSNLFYWLPTWK